MHQSRLCAVLIDCKTSGVEAAAEFWGEALGRGVDSKHAGSRGNEVGRLEKLGARVAERLERWVVMQAPTGQRFCVVRVQRPGSPKNAVRWS
jgi:hypothetical protein